MGIFKKKNKVFVKTNIDFSDNDDIVTANLKNDNEDLVFNQQEDFDFITNQPLNSVGFNQTTDLTSEDNSLTVDFSKRPNLVSNQEVESYLLVSYDQIQEVVDGLLANRLVRVDLTSIDSSQERKRIVDFLSGIVYAFSGTVETVGVRIYSFKIE